jgi:L-fuculose-phosphate aldolase
MADDIDHHDERASVSELGRAMVAQDLTKGTGGNVSGRCADGETVAMSPSGVPYGDITPEMVPLVTLDEEQVAGDLDPSDETPMHTMIYRQRDDVGGVIHTHSPYASTFASLAEPIPASHYLIAFAGDQVPVAGWDQPGTEELGQLAVDALGDEYDACLLRNHGTISVGPTAEAAYEVALMVEHCARIHYQATRIGDPVLLDDDEIEHLTDRFADYGQTASRGGTEPDPDEPVSEERLAELEPEREAVGEYGREMLHQGLTRGTGGNISARDGDLVAISPSGMPYDEIDTEDVPIVSIDGEHVAVDRKPSSEFRMHTGILAEREEAGAVVHTHSPYASTFASLAEPITASHYLIAFAGDQIPVAGYATYGTQDLADLAVEALGEEYDACLLQNHGTIALGDTVGEAFEKSMMVEYCARIHYQSNSIGEPTLVPDGDVDALIEAFESYGQH